MTMPATGAGSVGKCDGKVVKHWNWAPGKFFHLCYWKLSKNKTGKNLAIVETHFILPAQDLSQSHLLLYIDFYHISQMAFFRVLLDCLFIYFFSDYLI